MQPNSDLDMPRGNTEDDLAAVYSDVLERERSRLRDVFACAAVTGLCSGNLINALGSEALAKLAYEVADRMLKHRSK